jgi:uncharacterized membrane protein
MTAIKMIIEYWCMLGVIIWIGMVIIIMLFLRGSEAKLNQNKTNEGKE